MLPLTGWNRIVTPFLMPGGAESASGGAPLATTDGPELVPVPEPSSAILLGTAIVSAMLLSGFQRPVLPEPVRREQGYLEATS